MCALSRFFERFVTQACFAFAFVNEHVLNEYVLTNTKMPLHILYAYLHLFYFYSIILTFSP